MIAVNDRLPPQNIEAEECVLGSMLLDNACIDDVAALIRPEDFFRDSHQTFCAAILAIHGSGSPVDAIILEEWLLGHGRLSGVGGDRAIAEILAAPPHAANAVYYAQVVQQKAVARSLIEHSHATLRESYSNTYSSRELIEQAESRVFAIGESRCSGDVSELHAAIDSVNGLIDRRARGEYTGVTSGFDDLDDMTGGFHPGTLTIVGGRPSMGKTAFVLNILDHAAVDSGVVPAMFSLEMGQVDLGMRMLQSRAEVDGYRLKNAHLLTDAERAKLRVASLSLQQNSFPIDDNSSRTIAQIKSVARRLKARRGIGLVTIDYLQLVDGDGKNRQEQVASISRGMKQLAKELNLPVIALSQINRQVEGREDRRPRMADLRESGAIEQDADVVILLHRPEYYDPDDEPGVAEAIVAKNRNGGVGAIKFCFRKQFAKFCPIYPEFD